MKGIKVLAIIVGFVVDFVGSLFAGLVVGIGLMAFYAAQGVPLKQIMVRLNSEHLTQSFPVLFASIGLGEICVLAGGFVTGWMARNNEIKNAVGMGIFSALLGLAFAGSYPIWYNTLCVLVTPPIAALGGYIAQLIFAKRQGA